MQEMSNFQQVQGGIEILNKCQEISGNWWGLLLDGSNPYQFDYMFLRLEKHIIKMA